MQTLEQFWRESETGYEHLRRTALSAVERWIYGTSDLFRFDQQPFEALGVTRGREVKSEDKAQIRYGLDRDGRIVYERRGDPRCRCFQESILRYEQGTVFGALYDCSEFDGQVFARFMQAKQLVLDRDGKAVSLQTGIGTSAIREKYSWEDGKLARVDSPRLGGRTEIQRPR